MPGRGAPDTARPRGGAEGGARGTASGSPGSAWRGGGAAGRIGEGCGHVTPHRARWQLKPQGSRVGFKMKLEYPLQ